MESQMETPQLRQEIDDTLGVLIADRDHHRTALRYAQSTISELETQNRELELLLANAQAYFQRGSKVPKPKVPQNTSWIGGTWLSCPTATPVLTPVEQAWQKGQIQKALALLTLILLQDDLTHRHRVDAELLLAAITRSSGDVSQARVHAEKALVIARENQLYDLVGKAQFHRGLSYLYEDEYANARWCFVLASFTPGHKDQVEVNRDLAESSLINMPHDHPGRALTLRFL